MTRRICSILVVSSLILGSVGPLPAEEVADRPVSLRADAERAAARVAEDLGPALSDRERRDLEGRSQALPTDPVAGQAGGGGGTLLLMLIGTAVSIGTAYYFIKQSREETNKVPEFRR
jgi:hypothetical protein